MSADDFVEVCEAEFAKRGWRSSVSVVSEVRVAVDLDASTLLGAQHRPPPAHRAGPSEDRETVENVAKVLGGMWQVLWVEPKQFFRPTIRYASKMLTFPSTHAAYQSDLMRKATTNALNSPSQTGRMDVTSVATGQQTGKFCIRVADTPAQERLVVVGANGSHPALLNPLATAVVGQQYLVEPLHDDGFERATAVELVFPAGGTGVYFDDDYFAGMQIELEYMAEVDAETPTIVAADCFPWPAEATREMQQYGLSAERTCPRMITRYSAATRRADIYPPWKLESGMHMQGRRVKIRPLLMPGDQVTVLADAAEWRASVELDWLQQELRRGEPAYTAAADQSLRLHCARLSAGGAHNLVKAGDSTATFLRDHGFGPLQVRCRADVPQQGAVSLAKTDADIAAALSCTQVCRSDRAVSELETATGACVFNQSRVVATEDGGGRQCRCSYQATVALRVDLRLPDANPLWDRGLDGSGQVVGMADTGLDATNCLLSERDPDAPASSNLVRGPAVSTGGGGEVDRQRRKVVGYQATDPKNCSVCDTCAKRIRWDRTLLFGASAEVRPGFQFKTPFPHRCGDEAGAILARGGPDLRDCCGHTCEGDCPQGPVSPCGSCVCTLNMEGLKECVDDTGADCTYREPDCSTCCWACGHDARLWPRRYDRYGAELEVGIEAIAPPPGDFPVNFRLFVLTRQDYERYVIWSQDNPGMDPPIQQGYACDGTDECLPAPRCLNPDCMRASSKMEMRGEGGRIRLPPSRYGYGVVITNAESQDLPDKHVFRLYGLLADGVGLQMYTAARPCGDASDDAAGHGTLCASVAAGAVDPDVPSRAERLAARPYQGIAKGAGVFMFDLSAGTRGADNITVPVDLYSGVLKPSYERGVRIMSNSWSCYFPQVVCDQLGCVVTKADYCNSYSTAASDIDTFVADHTEMLVLVPAGDTNVLAYDAQQKSVRSPGTCKNCIAVGSTHTYHSALLQSIPHMDAMDKMSAPLRAHRPLCPRNLLGEERLWRAEETSAVEDAAGDDGDGSMPQTTPAGQGVSLQDFIRPEDKYAIPQDCCEDDPKHNELVHKFIQAYMDQLQLQRDNGQPQAIIQKQLDKIAAERARLYPCQSEPSCCNLNEATKDDTLDADDWNSLGPQQATCCKDSYTAVTRAANPIHKTDFDVDKVASFSAQGPVTDDTVLSGDFKGANPPEGLERIKPDLVAPGAYVVGANSRGNTLGGRVRHCDLPGDPERPFHENNTLVAMGGTSISTAILAGAAAIVRQYFEEGYYPSGSPVARDRLTPSAALLKAVLINSASSVQDSAARDESKCKTYAKGLLTATCVPNYQEGWGRPNIADVLPPAPAARSSPPPCSQTSSHPITRCCRRPDACA